MCDVSGMTTLKAYFENNPGLTQDALAKRIGISRSYLAEILSGAKEPGRNAMRKIEAGTDGAVPASSWFRGPEASA